MEKTKKQHPRAKKIWAGIFYVITGIAVFGVSLIGFSARWAFTNWGDLDIDEIIFQLKTPLEGTGNGMVGNYILTALLPALAVFAVFLVLMIILKQSKQRIICSISFLAASAVVFVMIQPIIWKRLDVQNWIEGQVKASDFLEGEYVDPHDVKMTFPEKKRNLIYIYLESMETTYADEASGGAFPQNTIPELTNIAMENEDFSGNDELLNGGIVFPGTGFTTGAIFAQSAGLPLKLSIGGNNMDTQSSFFPEVMALGDVLEEEGYRQVFLLGSDATFGGRRLFFKDHGDFEFQDYVYAQESGRIPSDYMVWWGYEDEKLFEYAKETVTELADGDEPFNLTMLTVDTHFEDGYLCEDCGNEFGDNQYANVMACSSKRVSEFLSWLQEQDFYENTTVILSGDHTTMDTDFCENVPEEYQRKTYTAYVNSAIEPVDPSRKREFSTFDNFPTTLASLGVEISGERLGLGTNLFSTKQTLVEKYGHEYMRGELSRRSAFLEELEKVDVNTDAMYEKMHDYLRYALVVEGYDEKSGELQIRVNENAMTDIRVDHVEVEFQEYGKRKVDVVELEEDPQHARSHIGVVDISDWSRPVGEMRVNYYTTKGLVYENLTNVYIDYELGDKTDFAAYFNALAEHPEYTVFLAMMDEGTEGFSLEMQEALYGLGLKTSLLGKTGTSYLAIVDDGAVYEACDLESLEYEDKIKGTDVKYYLLSAGSNSGSEASIQIDDKEYAINLRGLNFVVYDREAGSVIDAGYFDTHVPSEP